MGNKKFNLKLLVYTLTAAVIAFSVTELMLYFIKTEVPFFVLMSLYFGITTFFAILAALLCELNTERINGRYWSLHFGKKMYKFIPAFAAIVMIIAGLLQFAYEQKYSKTGSTDDYIILIDNSGSMINSDEQNIRFEAAISFINRMTDQNRLAVYLFDFDITEVVPLQTMTGDTKIKASEKIKILETNLDGGTYIKNSVDNLFDKIEPSLKSGRTAKVILLSDGLDNTYDNLDLQAELSDYIIKNVKIDTIMLLDKDGADIMQKLALYTGGTSVYIDNANELVDAYGDLFVYDEPRNLVEKRNGIAEDMTLYAVLRILFIVIISILISCLTAFALDNSGLLLPYMLKGAVSGLAAGFIYEFLVNNNDIFSAVMRLFALAVIMAIVSFFTIKTYDGSDESGGYDGLDNTYRSDYSAKRKSIR